MSIVDQIIEKGIPYRRSGDGVLVHCPFHDDSTPSMWITRDNFAYCFGCGWSRKVDSFPELGLNGSYPARRNGSVKRKPRQPPPAGLDEDAHMDLMSRPEKLEYLLGRGIAMESIVEYRLGYTDAGFMVRPRYSIPVYGMNGELINMKFRADPSIEEAGTGFKYISYPGALPYVFNAHRVNRDQPLVCVGGELDCIVAHQCGLNAISPMSESIERDPLIRTLFPDQPVIVLFDKDEAGIKHGMRAERLLGKPVIHAVWPHPAEWGEDLSDIYLRLGKEYIVHVVERLGLYLRSHPKGWW